MIHNPCISVIIPVYKVEDYIEKSLESLQNQTFTNFEAIIVNDGSPDQSISKAKKLVGNDPRFIFLNKQNGGQASARNMGLDYANGQYISFLDSDDTFNPNCLEKCMNIFKKYKDVEVVLFGINWIDLKNNISKVTYPDIKKYYDKNDILMTQDTINYSVWNKVYKKEVWENKRFIENIIYEDKEILPRLLYKKKLYLLKKPLYNYLQREGSTMHSYNTKSLYSILKVYDEYEVFLKSNGIYQEYKKYYYKSYIKFCYFVELTHLIKHSKNFTVDYSRLEKLAKKKNISLKKIKYYFGMFSKFFLFALLMKTFPYTTSKIYKYIQIKS